MALLDVNVDVLDVVGALALNSGAILNLNLSGPGADQPVYVIADYGSLSGTFTTVNNLPSNYTLNYDYQGANEIALVSVPEPASIGILGLGGVAMLARRRIRKTPK